MNVAAVFCEIKRSGVSPVMAAHMRTVKRRAVSERRATYDCGSESFQMRATSDIIASEIGGFLAAAGVSLVASWRSTSNFRSRIRMAGSRPSSIGEVLIGLPHGVIHQPRCLGGGHVRANIHNQIPQKVARTRKFAIKKQRADCQTRCPITNTP